ncbi:MAG TPA: PAS domain-containing sensor histidine kinase [Thermoanaerobaculia bacterium]|nr:PAS domain-containing sensor histidine kinase [Thermoanaerobaculia bacterium]
MDSLLNTAPCGYFTFADDGTIVEVNQTLADMLGYSRVEIAGWHVEKLLPPGGRIFYHTYLMPLLKMERGAEEIYIALRTKSGEEIPVLLNAARNERDGRAVNDCVCLRMIRRHEYEDQLLQARRLAEESSAAKAKFLSMMSHDLRAPLTTIYGNAQLLAADAELLSSDQMQAIETIMAACRMQMTLMTDILEFARAEAGQIHVRTEPVVVRDAVARAAKLMHVQATEAGLQFTLRDSPSEIVAAADPDRLQQILLNLLTNAVKFTPPGGEVALWCDGDETSARIHVRDTGIGIPPDQLQHIFAPFVQLDPAAGIGARRGVGLGLAISRDLARAMGGDVSVKSAPGEGSCFTIELVSSPATPALALANL